MRWPRWFPYPVNWIRSGLALFFVIVITYAVIATGFIGALISSTVDHPAPLFAGIAAGLVIPIFFLAVVHKSLFRRNVPGWFPRWSSWYEGLMIILGSCLSLLVMMPFFAASCGRYSRFYGSCRYLTNGQAAMILIIGLVFAAFLFQSEYLIRQAIGNSRKPKTVQPVPDQSAPEVKPSPKPPSNTILSELERLKREIEGP